ncbi:response regulator transcription factor [Streptomyces sp.]|uniref:response regulator transcription factor n=1 Tax=Streptomyces sp. TaxID=1931 RepID=UPI002F410C89
MGANDGIRNALERRISRIKDFAVLPHDRKHQQAADVVMVAADRNEFEVTRRITSRAATARPPLLLVVDEPFEELMSALWLGARGIVLNSATDRELVDCAALVARQCVVVPEKMLNDERLPDAHTILDGTTHHDARAALNRLTPRELEVLKLVGAGRNNAEIAEALWLSRNTVRSHVQRLMRKLGLRNRLCLIIFAHELRLMNPAGTILCSDGPAAPAAASHAVHAPHHGL